VPQPPADGRFAAASRDCFAVSRPRSQSHTDGVKAPETPDHSTPGVGQVSVECRVAAASTSPGADCAAIRSAACRGRAVAVREDGTAISDDGTDGTEETSGTFVLTDDEGDY
jgi:hypothetical protein